MGRPRIEPRWIEDVTTGCWIWQLAMNYQGYGICWSRGMSRRAHRVVYEELRGAVDGDLHIDHLCRNRACVNPEHLEPVTQTVNVQRGANAVLNTERVSALRVDRDAGMTYGELGLKYGLSKNSIGNIVRGETWQNVPLGAATERTAA